jgi:outer membrane protein OmpA-like peptidoglycan-associated protein
VALSGTFNPLKTPTALDLKLTFDGVDLASFTPYAGTYAGYAIDRGLLDLHLQYTLADNHLKAQNDIRIEQLKLGEQVDSDKAIDAPLKLAISLMTDSNGVIDMKVPLAGNVNEPGFELSGVITQAIINIITKAVTAPFSLLAGLVDSEEDLQKLTFASGSADLGDAATNKLTQLTAALAQRPELSLVITGRVNPTADREHLQTDILQAQLLEAGLATGELDGKGPAWEKAIDKRFKALPASPAQNPELTATEKYALVVESINVGDAELLELAENRAVAVKSYLVNEAGMEANRAVIGRSTLDKAADLFSGVDLSLDN